MRQRAASILILLLLAGILSGSPPPAQQTAADRPTESGGILPVEQASYDVLEYDLSLRVDPEQKSIHGFLTLEARVVQPLSSLLVDLDDRFRVHSVEENAQLSPPAQLPFERPPGRLRIDLRITRQPGEEVRVTIEYSGMPREAPRPPWVGGFIWARDVDGRPWIGVACQLDGADIWWPCKDHPSDEPDRMQLHITVPSPLVVASNGTLEEVTENDDDSLTYHWKISNPINIYNVTLNAANYTRITSHYESITGETLPVFYWILPESLAHASHLTRQVPLHLRFLEEMLGPYPFRNEKYGVVETPYLGMEHQTIISYGNHYRNNTYGFDWLHLHELAHEWWGNLVTVTDWRDYWIHEGFASYMEALYAERLQGASGLRAYVAGFRSRLRNREPLAPTDSRTTVQKYFIPPNYLLSDGDVNFKGACVLHTLRYLVGEEAFFKALRRFLYPDPSRERVTDGSQCRFVSTEDFLHTVETVSGRNLGWFFAVYLRETELPRLVTERRDGFVEVRWLTPRGLPFPMPLEAQIDGKLTRLEIPGGESVRLEAPPDGKIVLDPDEWILKESAPGG